MLRKTWLGIFLTDIQTKDGIFKSVENVVMNFVVKVNLKRQSLMEPNSFR